MSEEHKLHVEKLSDGGITCLRLAGTIDESFDGKRLAATVKAHTLLLDLKEVRKISSFGIREWVDFVSAVGERVESLILVECAPKVVDQLNMVMNFAGKGQVFSFYAPYRCDYCDVDKRVLLQVDRDHDAIRALKPPGPGNDQPCETCGNPVYFDEDPASFFSYVAGQPRFELEPPVAAFLSAKLAYTVSDAARRFRAEKHIAGRLTYLRLAGDLDGSFPAEKVAEGLEGWVAIDLGGIGKIDPAGAAAWRGFVALISTTCEQMWLYACPPVFLERLARAEDLGRAQVVSLTVPYTCSKCAATASHTLDVAEHFDVLKFATAPEVACPDCGAPAHSAASEALLAHLGALSRPNVPEEVRKLVAAAREVKPAAPRLTSAVGAAVAPARRGGAGLLWVALVGLLLAAGVVAVVAFRPFERGGGGGPRLMSRSADQPPAWVAGVTVDAPGTCVTEGTTFRCAGAASGPSDAVARLTATEAALEALVEDLAGGIADPELRRLAVAHYAPARQRLAASLAEEPARAARRSVVAALRTAAPVTQVEPEIYWELWRDGSSSTTRAYVRFAPAPPLAELRARFTTPEAALGAKVVTFFPGLAWRYTAVTGGAQIVALDAGPLRDAGLAVGDVVLELEDRPVASAAGFTQAAAAAEERLKTAGGAMRLVVKSGDGEPRAFNVAIGGAAPALRPRSTGSGPRPATDSPATGGVNVWDRTGGGSTRDDPNQ